MTRRHVPARRWPRAAALALALALVPGAAHATASQHEGRHLRLDSAYDSFLLSPGDSVRWEVGVDLSDPPSPAEIALRITASGPPTPVRTGISLALDWCTSPAEGCAGATSVLPPPHPPRH